MHETNIGMEVWERNVSTPNTSEETKESVSLEYRGSNWQNSNFQLQAWIANKAHTPWEKYRLLCNQLENRLQALGTVEAAEKRRRAKIAKFRHLQKNGYEWEELEAEAEVLEAEAGKARSQSCIRAARQEVEFIRTSIAKLEPELERDRIPGYTDQEMFQHCQEEEWTRELIHRAENHYISRIFGGFPPDQIAAMRSHPLWESTILPQLKQMHQTMMPQIAIANSFNPEQHQNLLSGTNDGRGTEAEGEDAFHNCS